MNNSLAWPAPAKLNLFLHIVGLRADGYHLLQTVFQFIDWCDWLQFAPRDDGRIALSEPLLDVADDENLIVRAARALQRSAGIKAGADIHLQKQLPMGGGLGGGSSDAATTLVALNAIWGAGLSSIELAEIGVQLGADVPIFVHGSSAFAEGVGEALTPIAPEEPIYLLALPDCHVPTADMFAVEDLIRNAPPVTIHDFLAGRSGNVFEQPVRRRYPAVDAALRKLSERAEGKLSGTGSTVFAAVSSREVAGEIAGSALSGIKTVIAQGLNRSPLLDRLEQFSAGGC